MGVGNQGIDLSDIAELDTRVGTTNALAINGLAADPIFEFTIAIVVLTSNGVSGD